MSKPRPKRRTTQKANKPLKELAAELRQMANELRGVPTQEEEIDIALGRLGWFLECMPRLNSASRKIVIAEIRRQLASLEENLRQLNNPFSGLPFYIPWPPLSRP